MADEEQDLKAEVAKLEAEVEALKEAAAKEAKADAAGVVAHVKEVLAKLKAKL